MTDAEKIEWLSATNKALMKSQERLAGEIVELRDLLRQMKHNVQNGVQFWNSRVYRDTSDSLLENIDKVLR